MIFNKFNRIFACVKCVCIKYYVMCYLICSRNLVYSKALYISLTYYRGFSHIGCTKSMEEIIRHTDSFLS